MVFCLKSTKEKGQSISKGDHNFRRLKRKEKGWWTLRETWVQQKCR